MIFCTLNWLENSRNKHSNKCRKLKEREYWKPSGLASFIIFHKVTTEDNFVALYENINRSTCKREEDKL